MDNLEEMNKCVETYILPKLNQDEADNLNRWITRSHRSLEQIDQSVVTKKKKKTICKQKSRTK